MHLLILMHFRYSVHKHQFLYFLLIFKLLNIRYFYMLTHRVRIKQSQTVIWIEKSGIEKSQNVVIFSMTKT